MDESGYGGSCSGETLINKIGCLWQKLLKPKQLEASTCHYCGYAEDTTLIYPMVLEYEVIIQKKRARMLACDECYDKIQLGLMSW